ncbi:hypothetical protein [uncultured Mediterranean phage uvMED]|nr:hypothetical protein [uncultured Mediterranean phage uvMED]
MTFLHRSKELLNNLELSEEYEKCAKLRDLILIIESKNKKEFLNIFFDKNSLLKEGFILNGESLESKIIYFFDLENIFDYIDLEPNTINPLDYIL